MKFVQVFFWEFFQNLLPIAGFILALELWQAAKWGMAMVCIVISSAVGSLVIRTTEARIVQDFAEPWSVTIMNTVVMVVSMSVLVGYLSADWSSWKTDLPIGALVGIVLGAAQSLAARERIGIVHCVALACSFPLALIGIRGLVGALPALVNILIVTFATTLLISFIDYWPAGVRETA